jgi:hypothetical protein
VLSAKKEIRYIQRQPESLKLIYHDRRGDERFASLLFQTIPRILENRLENASQRHFLSKPIDSRRLCTTRDGIGAAKLKVTFELAWRATKTAVALTVAGRTNTTRTSPRVRYVATVAYTVSQLGPIN